MCNILLRRILLPASSANRDTFSNSVQVHCNSGRRILDRCSAILDGGFLLRFEAATCWRFFIFVSHTGMEVTGDEEEYDEEHFEDEDARGHYAGDAQEFPEDHVSSITSLLSFPS